MHELPAQLFPHTMASRVSTNYLEDLQTPPGTLSC